MTVIPTWGRRSVLAITTFVALSMGAMAHANEASVARLLTQKFPALSAMAPQPHALPVSGLYELNIAGHTAYTDEGVNYLLVGGELLAGSGHDVRNLTQERAAAAHAALPSTPSTPVAAAGPDVALTPLGTTGQTLAPVSSANASPHGLLKVFKQEGDAYDHLPFDKAIPLVYGNGQRKLAMFADPDCPYCQRMEGMMNAQGAALNATVYVFLWPLTIHPHSNEKADYLWCQPDRAQAWTSWMVFADAMNSTNPNADEEDVWKAWLTQTHRPPVSTCHAQSPRETIRALAQSQGLVATPTLIFENGASINHGVDMQQLDDLWKYVYTGQMPPNVR